MTPALIQQREDAALGAAWRRCEAALPEGWFGPYIEPQWRAWAVEPSFGAVSEGLVGNGYGPTPTEALTALAEALEAKRAAE